MKNIIFGTKLHGIRTNGKLYALHSPFCNFTFEGCVNSWIFDKIIDFFFSFFILLLLFCLHLGEKGFESRFSHWARPDYATESHALGRTINWCFLHPQIIGTFWNDKIIDEKYNYSDLPQVSFTLY